MPRTWINRKALDFRTQHNIRKPYIYSDNQYSPSEGYFNAKLANHVIESIAAVFHVSKEAAKYRLKTLDLLREGKESESKIYIRRTIV